ncbi:FAD-dependent monooxygenase [Gallaecimonas xiamenensis]|uniref:2-octaprenyl-6-methoxyphenol hydroxylase n=1 Tax=Gallaecimonas xiamenensis 3-C-1 TaxID=745411 RepID=K2J4C6_9GAMM|nr:FAD-dependent monooxygenase [Gallaecimonas xiamenensis]EKE69928.1 2-octaprenyl-6-methoxyphenol hydroxylase [Gallaecimonas xiamenensis 3-C-1]
MAFLESQVTVVGGGMVGAALALMLGRGGVKVLLLDGQVPAAAFGDVADTRVSAISEGSRQILAGLKAWPHIQRKGPYQAMSVWEKDCFGKLDFSAEDVKAEVLGHIVENRQIQLALWQELGQCPAVTLKAPAKLTGLEQGQERLMLTLDNGDLVATGLLVGADGANSLVRTLADLPLIFHDYGHHALVATVATELPHEGCARQVFRPQGPLAFLPLWQPNQCSIVWSTVPSEADALMALAPEAFSQRLRLAFDNRLGALTLLSDVQRLPLTARYARDFVKPRIALVGDAAHSIHPLAGQGVNLGLADALALAEQLLDALGADKDLGDLKVLAPYGRARKAQALKMLAAMGSLKTLFGNGNPLIKLMRNAGLAGVGSVPVMKRLFIEEARGVAVQEQLVKVRDKHQIFSP